MGGGVFTVWEPTLFSTFICCLVLQRTLGKYWTGTGHLRSIKYQTMICTLVKDNRFLPSHSYLTQSATKSHRKCCPLSPLVRRTVGDAVFWRETRRETPQNHVFMECSVIRYGLVWAVSLPTCDCWMPVMVIISIDQTWSLQITD